MAEILSLFVYSRESSRIVISEIPKSTKGLNRPIKAIAKANFPYSVAPKFEQDRLSKSISKIELFLQPLPTKWFVLPLNFQKNSLRREKIFLLKLIRSLFL
jgi:hypothetical protein